MKDWKPTKPENPDYRCGECQSDDVWYLDLDNDYGDIKYECRSCKRVWYYEGADS